MNYVIVSLQDIFTNTVVSEVTLVLDDLDYITQEELKDMCNLDIITFIGK